MNLSHYMDQQASINQKMLSAMDYIHWEKASTLSEFWLEYQRAIDTVVKHIKAQPIRRFVPDLLSFIPLVAYLGSSLFSRPPHHSWWNEVKNMIATRQCSKSNSLFLIDTIEVEDSFKLLFNRPLPASNIGRVLYNRRELLVRGPMYKVIDPIPLPVGI
ncbi:hypothetical protein BDA99DRAFT_336270 [Phascolomyces articulosus]|uniref:Uncharacterized protein n=1 Tax=Phascolomyces articulosus TaxID=60185 RepID=A0AAD5PG12_9FUNG|nr:hypothetical protein BDA99DRAFT_336270 [Phascolomyces articulosus]